MKSCQQIQNGPIYMLRIPENIIISSTLIWPAEKAAYPKPLFPLAPVLVCSAAETLLISEESNLAIMSY